MSFLSLNFFNFCIRCSEKLSVFVHKTLQCDVILFRKPVPKTLAVFYVTSVVILFLALFLWSFDMDSYKVFVCNTDLAFLAFVVQNLHRGVVKTFSQKPIAPVGTELATLTNSLRCLSHFANLSCLNSPTLSNLYWIMLNWIQKWAKSKKWSSTSMKQ